MTVKELIKKLSRFPQHWNVVVVDAHNNRTYGGDFIIHEFCKEVDIEVGGLEVEQFSEEFTAEPV